MGPQEKLNEQYLHDTFETILHQEYDAVRAVARLRLYAAASGYDGTLRDLCRKGGMSARDYDELLRQYNRQIAHQLGCE